MPFHRKLLFTSAMSLILLSAFQNCGSVKFDSQDSKQIELASYEGSGTGNGTGYDGKLTAGVYYRLIYDTTCSNEDLFLAVFDVTSGSAQLLKDDCTKVAVPFSVFDSRLYQSPYYRDLLAINDAIFERAVGETKPTMAVSAWCSIIGGNGTNHDVVIRTSLFNEAYQASIIETQKDSITGKVSEQRSSAIKVTSSISTETISFSASEFGFSLNLNLMNKSNYRVSGLFKAQTSVGSFDQEVDCLIASRDSIIPSTAQLIGFYNFDSQGTASILNLEAVVDATSFGHDGVAFNSNGNGFNIVSGKFGNGISLDGIDDYIDISALAASITNDFTVSLWFQTASLQTKSYLLTASADGNSNILRFGFGKCFTDFTTPSVLLAEFGSECYISGNDPVDASWHHAVFTVSPRNSTLYLDGVMKDQRSTAYSFDGNTRWAIGQDYDDLNPTDFFKGSIDEVMIWNGHLTAEQIKKISPYRP